MPSYFPEGDTPLPTDSYERLLQKATSLVSARISGAEAPSPDDSRERTMLKFVRGLRTAVGGVTTLDPDALAYAAVSGAVDIVAIDQFVKGVKALGLWDSMVCWPLRSRQNAGTGTTAYSLGGLGTFNGTLVNGPTWGTDGMTVADAAHDEGVEVQIGSLSFPELTLFAVGAASSVANVTHNLTLMAWSSHGGTQNGINLRTSEFLLDLGWVQQSGGGTGASVASANNTNFFAFAVSSDTSDVRVKRFPSSESSDVSLNYTGDLTNTNPLYIGRRQSTGSGSYGGTVSFASVVTKDTRSNWDQLYTLYKSTLGQGLGLP